MAFTVGTIMMHDEDVDEVNKIPAEATHRYDSSTLASEMMMMTEQPIAIASTCSSSSTGSVICSRVSCSADEESSCSTASKGETTTTFSASQSGYYGEDEVTLGSLVSSSCSSPGPHRRGGIKARSFVTCIHKKGLKNKLSLHLDDVRELVRLGRNATVKKKCRLPSSISKDDIYVQVDFDESARSSHNREMEQIVQDAIRDDLKAVYSANAESAKLFLCIVIVAMSDGSLWKSLLDWEGVIGQAEIGLVWRLFEADNLTVYGGGLVVQTEQVSTSIFDFVSMTNDGKECLLNRLVPRVANDLVSRIADSNEDLLVEI